MSYLDVELVQLIPARLAKVRFQYARMVVFAVLSTEIKNCGQ